jgi:hypothetical protein
MVMLLQRNQLPDVLLTKGKFSINLSDLMLSPEFLTLLAAVESEISPISSLKKFGNA